MLVFEAQGLISFLYSCEGRCQWIVWLYCRSVMDVNRYFKQITLDFGGNKWFSTSRTLDLDPEGYLIVSVSSCSFLPPSIWSMCFNCTCFGRDPVKDAEESPCEEMPTFLYMSCTFWLIQLHIDMGNFSLTGRWSPHLTMLRWHECRHKVMCVLAFWMQVEQVWRSQISLEVCSATANMCIVGWWLYTICTILWWEDF